MTNAMINAIFTGGVNHDVICIKEPPYRLKGASFANCYSVKLKLCPKWVSTGAGLRMARPVDIR